jgi:hypothetical protein
MNPASLPDVAVAQSAYYAVTGVWPLVSRRTFELVTGPKVDFWLAQTVGVLVTAVGAGLVHARVRGRQPPAELRTVAVGTAAGLAAVDVVFVAKGRISRVYLLDAALELLLIAGWLRSSRARS